MCCPRLKFFIFIIFFHLTSQAHQGDYSVTLGTRTTPVAIQAEANAGYGLLLWGEASTPLYGYFRPSVTLASSSTLTGTAALDFYPVSFLGFTIGNTYNNRLADLPSINCEKADCRNWLNFNFMRARLLGKFGSFVTSLQYEKRIYDSNDDKTKSFGEGSYVVLLAPQDEVSETWQAIVGYKFTEQFAAGINSEYFRTHKSEEHEEMQLLFAKRKIQEWTYTVGLGRFASSQFGIGPQAVFIITWTGLEKIGP